MNQMNSIASASSDAIASATVDRGSLRRAARLAAATAEIKAAVPVLTYAHVSLEPGQVRIAATDLDRETVSRFDAEVSGEIAVLIQARTLSAFADGAEGPVRLEVVATSGANVIVLTDGMTTLRLRDHIPAEDYPHQVERWRAKGGDAAAFDISPAALLRLLKLTRPCISTEETRYYLNGVFLGRSPGAETLRACSTDGHKLAEIKSDVVIPPLGERGVIVPTRTVETLLSQLAKGDGNQPWRLDVRGEAFAATCGGVEIWSKLIDGRYPDIDRVIGEPSENLVAHLSLGLLRRMAGLQMAMAGQRGSKAVELDPKAGEIRFRDPEGGSVAHPLQGSAQPGMDPIGFNLGYLLEIARLAGTCTLSAKGGGDPARIVGDDPDALWIVMPMRM